MSNQRILHVDDTDSVLRVVKTKLEKSGYEVHSLSDPEQTIKTLMETNIRVCILDINMPKLNGLDLLEQIKNFDGGIQVIMLTGEVSQSTILDSHRFGAEACFFKPIVDYAPFIEAVDHCFIKIDRWWRCLHELKELKGRYDEVKA